MDKDEIVFAFTCRVTGGQTTSTDEADDCQFFALDALPNNTSPKHVERILDAVKPGAQPVFRIQTGPSSRQWLEAKTDS